jgi:hypothetical protein
MVTPSRFQVGRPLVLALAVGTLVFAGIAAFELWPGRSPRSAGAWLWDLGIGGTVSVVAWVALAKYLLPRSSTALFQSAVVAFWCAEVSAFATWFVVHPVWHSYRTCSPFDGTTLCSPQVIGAPMSLVLWPLVGILCCSIAASGRGVGRAVVALLLGVVVAFGAGLVAS